MAVIILVSDVTFPYGPDSNWYVASLEFRYNGFYLTAEQPHFGNRYVCEYPGEVTSTVVSNV